MYLRVERLSSDSQYCQWLLLVKFVGQLFDVKGNPEVKIS